MQISTRFTMAVQTLLCVARFSEERRVTSKVIAESAGANPKVIRQLFGQLKEAGIIAVEPGVGGATLTREASEVTLLDVFRAVDSIEEDLFAFHGGMNPDCPVGSAMHDVLDAELKEAQAALEGRLAATALQDLIERLP